MATCRYCDAKIHWGQDENGKWVKLIPLGEEGDLDRTHQDEHGVLRAQHKCAGWTPAVKVVKLAKAIEAKDVLPIPQQKPAFTIKRKNKRKANEIVGNGDRDDDNIPF